MFLHFPTKPLKGKIQKSEDFHILMPGLHLLERMDVRGGRGLLNLQALLALRLRDAQSAAGAAVGSSSAAGAAAGGPSCAAEAAGGGPSRAPEAAASGSLRAAEIAAGGSSSAADAAESSSAAGAAEQVRAGLRNRMQDPQEGLSPLYTTPYGGKYHSERRCHGLRHASEILLTPRCQRCGPAADIPHYQLRAISHGYDLHTSYEHCRDVGSITVSFDFSNHVQFAAPCHSIQIRIEGLES